MELDIWIGKSIVKMRRCNLYLTKKSVVIKTWFCTQQIVKLKQCLKMTHRTYAIKTMSVRLKRWTDSNGCAAQKLLQSHKGMRPYTRAKDDTRRQLAVMILF